MYCAIFLITYWHTYSWRIKDQLDVTCYFISLLMSSTCFGHWYIHHQELATILLNYHIGRIVLGSMCVGVSVWYPCCTTCASSCNMDTTPTQPHWNSNTHRIKNNTTNVVIQQNSHKLLTMDISMCETCWAHKKWNKIASDIKLVFYSSYITMMHGPINIRLTYLCLLKNYPKCQYVKVLFVSMYKQVLLLL